MRLVNVFLRQGRVFAVGKKGTGGRFVDAAAPAVAEPTAEGVREALQAALSTSIIPIELPPDLGPRPSGLAVAAGVKSESAFYRGARLCSVRELDDRIDVLRGFRSGGGWHSKVVQKLARDITPRDLAAAVLAVLQEKDEPLPIKQPK